MPHFIEIKNLAGYNRRFSHLYDWFSLVYGLFSKAAFGLLGMREETARSQILDRLNPLGGDVLEVSIGNGVNIPYLIRRPDVKDIYGLDISPGQLAACQRTLRRKGWAVDLFLGNAEILPFKDNSFGSVFHIGGINFFNNKKAAIDEMIRVIRPGGRILIGDETEKGVKGFEKTLPGLKATFRTGRRAVEPPVDLVPQDMIEIKQTEIWKGWFYCIEFRKP